MKAIIDLDPLVHIVGNVQWANGNHDNEEQTRDHVRRFVRNLLSGTGCTEYVMFVQSTEHDNYRKKILPEYKNHRKTSEGMARWKKTIVSELVALGAYLLYEIECDDALALLGAKYNKEGCIIVENDKDLIQIPGLHYNPYKKDLEPRKFTVSNSEAAKSLWAQVLTGDPTDMPGSLCGIDKVGPKTAEKWLMAEESFSNWPQMVLKRYTDKYGVTNGLRRMTLTFNMVKLINRVSQTPMHLDEVPKVYGAEFTDYVNETDDLFENAESNDLFS